MNLVFFGIIIFILVFVLLSWFTKTSSKKIAKGARALIFILSVILAVFFVIAGRFSYYGRSNQTQPSSNFLATGLCKPRK